MARRKTKTKQSTPFKRNLVLDKAVKTTFKQKMEQKREREHIKALEASLKAEKQALIAEKKQRREENQKRREENAKKAEVVQSIKDVNKLKKIRKGSKRIRKI